MTFQPALGGSLAPRLFRPGSPEALALLRSAWPQAVGPDLSRRTQVVALEGATLRVRVPDARWRKVLHRMQAEILGRLRAVAGDLAPRRLGFDEGAVPAPPVVPVPTAEAMPRCPEPVASSADVIADVEIRRRFVEAAARYLSRRSARRNESVAPLESGGIRPPQTPR